MFFSGWPATLKQNLHRYESLQFFHKWFVRSIIKSFPSNTATGHSDLLKSTHHLRQICKTLLVPSPLSQRWKSFVLCKSMPLNVTAMEGWGYTVYTKKCPNDTCVSLWINPLSPSIHIQILQTDLYIFPSRMSWEN